MPTTNSQNHGFIPDVITPDHFVFGDAQLAAEELQPDGNWTPFLPPDDIQDRNNLETMNCTVYGTLNALKILFKRQFNLDFSFSERYVGIEAHTSPTGNSPHVVIEAIRTDCGLVDESLLPFLPDIDTWEEYYSPDPMDAALYKTGHALLTQFTFGHDWVFSPTDTSLSNDQKYLSMQTALKYSPLGVGVYAWEQVGDLYIRAGGDCHWVVIYGCDPGKSWSVFDTYDQTHKLLAWDFGFTFVKRYSIKRGPSPIASPQNWLGDLIQRIVAGVQWKGIAR